jgi:16S rRNA (guanine(527)-N(7))-methyltransferase RsmG
MFRELLRREFAPWGELSELQLDQLERHHQLLESWNRRLNLTRIQDLADVVRFHYCESLFLSTALPEGCLKVCDLGSGAGFPGIPLALFRPNVQVALIESDQRKAVFLREASRDLINVQVLATRHQACRLEFDWIVSRAVAVDEVLASGSAPNFALLLSGASAPPGAVVTKLPWGRDRVLAVSRGTHVSRETRTLS